MPNPATFANGVIAGTIVMQLNATDALYKRITAGNDKTDGVVEGTSQLYPNAIRNVTAAAPASHAGETRTEGSAEEVRKIMAQDLGVSPR